MRDYLFLGCLEPSDGNAGVESGPEAEFIPFMTEVVVIFTEGLYQDLFAIALRREIEGATHRKSEEGEHLSRVAQAQAVVKIDAVIGAVFKIRIVKVESHLVVFHQEHVFQVNVATVFAELGSKTETRLGGIAKMLELGSLFNQAGTFKSGVEVGRSHVE